MIKNEINVSIIMQSYLGDYPESRKNPKSKFIRAVYSVILQTIENWELIIVSDGCTITEQIYNTYFKHYKDIRLIKIPKSDETLMNSNGNYKRGLPKQKGVENAKGDWIMYLDSDDYILKNSIFKLCNMIKKISDFPKKESSLDIRYIINNSLVYNYKKYDNISNGEKPEGSIIKQKRGEPFKINGLPDMWISLKDVIKGSSKDVVSASTANIIHKRGYPKWEWCDTNSQNKFEDFEYISRIATENEIKHVMYISFPFYVKCFEKNNYDF
tara:strand:+ start:35464 stop:36273 length:810 start_codon:yes stop_codon:yes gene_type:complete